MVPATAGLSRTSSKTLWIINCDEVVERSAACLAVSITSNPHAVRKHSSQRPACEFDKTLVQRVLAVPALCRHRSTAYRPKLLFSVSCFHTTSNHYRHR